MEIYELDEYLRNESKVFDLFFATNLIKNAVSYRKISQGSQPHAEKIVMDKWENYLDSLIAKLDFVMKKDPHYSADEWVKFIEDKDMLRQLENDLRDPSIHFFGGKF